MAVARYVLPVPAGPMPKVIVLLRMASTYSFWFTVRGPDLAAAVRPDDVAVHLGGLARRVDGDVHERLDHRRVQRPPGADHRRAAPRGRRAPSPRRPSSPSRMSTLPRSVSVQSRRCSRILRCASCSPASVERLAVAVELDDRARHRRHGQPPSLPRTRSLSFLPSARPATLGLSQPITLPMSLGVTASVAATASSTSSSSSASRELLRHVALEELLLVALLVGEVLAARPVVELDGLGAPLALALEHRELVGLGGLLAAVDALLLERRDERVAAPRAAACRPP